MISIDAFEEMLNELAEELPEAFFAELNGGINLLPEAKPHPASKNGDLYIMGEYCVDAALGRYIVIYYGSFRRQYLGASAARLKTELRKTLRHEFRHHIESLSGERGLEIQDEIDLEAYLNG